MGVIDRIVCGGNQWSLDADETSGMDHYVHLCFRANHPMAYLAHSERRIAEWDFIRVDAEIVMTHGAYFTPGVSNKAGMPRVPIRDAARMLDFEILYEQPGPLSDPEISARLRDAEKYEVLIPDCVPIKYLGAL